MGTMRKIKKGIKSKGLKYEHGGITMPDKLGPLRTANRIKHNDKRVAMKVNLVPLGVAMIGCQLFVAVPEKPDMEPESIAQRVKASMSEMQERACTLSVRDVYEQVGMIQQKRMES